MAGLKSTFRGAIVIGGVLLHSPLLLAQAPIEEIAPLGSANSSQSATINGELVYQLQQLQQEVMELRGLIEEQNYAIQRLQQQRLDDYGNLDRRIGELTRTGGVAAGAGSTAPANPVVTLPPAGAPQAADAEQELAQYKTANGFIKAQRYDQAISAFEAFVAQYPNGAYTGNAYHWLGELHFLRGNLSQAESNYSALLSKFPDHRKAPEAMLKLARVYQQQGNASQAKAMAQRVISDYSAKSPTAAQMAKDFLRTYYP